MAPTLHSTSSHTTPELRRAHQRAGRDAGHGMRMRIRIPRARITYAESPELYLREEMS